MATEDFTDATLVVLGHGATAAAGAAAPVRQHAAALRARGMFAAVREAFWKQPPQVRTVLAGLKTPRVFIVPLFISEGWFAGEVIPRELGFGNDSKLKTQNSTWFYCSPVGTHAAMTGVLLARAAEVVKQFPFPRAPKAAETTLFIAGHGTERDGKSRQAVERQAELIRAQNLYAAVHAIFLEEPPRIADWPALAATRHVVVVPFFIGDGPHTQVDIPVLLGEPERIVQERLAAGQPTWRNPTEKNGRLVWYASAAGTAPEIAAVILARVKEAATSP